MSDGHVRRARPADRPRLRTIQAAALTEPWPALLEPESPLAPRLWVYEERAAGVLGYAAALTADEPVAYLPEVAVEPARQGEGYGSQLLTAVLADLAENGFERVRLTARAGDERVRRFYGRHGFEPVERVPDRFRTGDGLVLARQLGRED